jgi:hypothetical protein
MCFLSTNLIGETMNVTQIKVAVCRLRFKKEALAAFEAAGGGSWDSFLLMTGKEMMDRYASNGIALCHTSHNSAGNIQSNIEEVAEALNFEQENKK